MDIFNKLVEKIIQEQENIIGPLAIEQAQKVPGLKINWQKHEVMISSDHKVILEKLANQYKHIFGQASVEVCRDVIHSMISQIRQEEIPPFLL